MDGATPILLVGCGKMGGALLSGWLARGVSPDEIAVVEPNGTLAGAVAERHGVPVAANPEGAPAGFRPATVVFAVKPQAMNEAAPGCARFVDDGAMVLSIAAGRTIASFEAVFGADKPIVRCMPNTPAAVGRGITALVANVHVAPALRGAADRLLRAVGETVWLDDEGPMDAVTALSGAGPAYVFLLIETLAKAGAAAGLPGAVAARLSHATVTGAAELARRADETPERLRRNVTSPGGATLAALEVLMADDGVQPLFDRALAAATRRSRELAG